MTRLTLDTRPDGTPNCPIRDREPPPHEADARLDLSLEACGHMAGGIAHHFNNLLTIIIGWSALLADRTNRTEEEFRWIGEIRSAAERAAVLTRQLLAFSGRPVVAPRVVDLGAVLRDAGPTLRLTLGPSIELKTASAPGTWPVRADLNQLYHILAALVANARDAMPGGGHLTIEVGHAEEDTFTDSVQLTVTDTGCGMLPGVLDRAFEPFFTTKTGAAGLGLSAVYGAVRRAGGCVAITSEVGHGTTVRICWPMAVVEE